MERMNRPSDSQVNRLLAVLRETDAISKLSDAQLADEVIRDVWGKFPMGSRASNLVDELLRRFEMNVGIARNERGEVI